MPRKNQSQAQARARRRKIMAALSRSPGAPGPGGKPPMPPRTPPGVAATPKPGVPVGEPVPKDVRQMGGGGPPRSTLPREGSLGNISDLRDTPNMDAILERMSRAERFRGGNELGAYNLTHRQGEPIGALLRRRRQRKRKPGVKAEVQFGGPEDGRPTGA